MVSNEDTASLSIEAFQGVNSLLISRVLNHETKVHRDALVADSGSLGIILGMVGFLQFGLGTDRAGVQFIGHGKLGQANHKLVEVGGSPVVKMAKPLVPEKTELIPGEGVNPGFLRIDTVRAIG